MGVMAEVAKTACFLKACTHRLAPTQNQQGPGRSLGPPLIGAGNEVEQTTNWLEVPHQGLTAQSHAPVPEGVRPHSLGLTFPGCKMATARAGTSLPVIKHVAEVEVLKSLGCPFLRVRRWVLTLSVCRGK